MLHKCANPDCVRPFRKLAEGKLFLAEVDSSYPPGQTAKLNGQTLHRVEYFWLCEQCAGVLTLTFDKGRGMVTVPLPISARKGPAAVCSDATVGNAARAGEYPLSRRA
jgi:hypothetical protein